MNGINILEKQFHQQMPDLKPPEMTQKRRSDFKAQACVSGAE
jgi:hypothetical protein